MHSAEFIRQVVREAKKSSVMQAARKFAVAYSTIKIWLKQEIERKELSRNLSQIKRSVGNKSEDKTISESGRNGETISKSLQFLGYCDSLQPFAQIAVKYIKLNCSNELPKWFIVAYDLKTGGLNFCFTYENNKSNKSLYLLYVNSFLQEQGISTNGFISRLQLNGINTYTDRSFNRMIATRIKMAISPFEAMIKTTSSISELLTKSYIFLVDYNLSKKTSAYLHPPFVLDNDLTAYNFVNNTLMLKGLNEKVRATILKVTCNYHQQKQQLPEFSNERLLTIFEYFIKQGMKNRCLEEKIVHDAANLQLMGELSRSELLLKSLLKNKELTEDGRNTLYLTYGRQKLHNEDFQGALRYYKKTVTGCKQTGNLQMEFSALRNICKVWLYQGKMDKAYRYLRMAQRVSNVLNDGSVSANYSYLSGFYLYSRGDYKQSVLEFEYSIMLSKQNSSPEDYIRAILGYTNLLMSMKKYKKALKYALQILSAKKKSGFKIPICISHLRCADCYFELCDSVSTEMHLQACLTLLKDVNYPSLELSVRELYIKLLKFCNRDKEAEQQLEQIKNSSSK